MSLKENFLMACFIQSIFVAILLIRPNKNRLANILLMMWVLTWGGMCYYRFMIFQDEPYALKFHYLLKGNNILYLLFFVFPFLYIKYISNGLRNFRRKDYIHFIPAAFGIVALIPFFILPAEEKIRILLLRRPYDKTLSVLFDYIVIVQGFVYVYLSLKYIKAYHIRIRENYSNIDHLTLYWLRNIIIIIFSVWLLGTLEAYLFKSGYMTIYYVNFLFVIIGLSIFYISYNLYAKIELFFISNIIETEPELALPIITENENTPNTKDKKNDCLSNSYCDEVIENLTRIMETEKLYLNQNLNLEDISCTLSISRHHISAILNNRLHISFFDYVNKYRIEEVKRRLIDPQYEKLTLLAIAFDSGFNSKATFNRSFKKLEGITPLEYRNRNK